MQVAVLQNDAETIMVPQLKAEQYMTAVQKTAMQLHWFLAGVNGNVITYHARNNDYPPGEVITITVLKDKITISSKAVNEYYFNEQQNQVNADLFRTAIKKVADELEKADRNLHPMHREKYGALVPSKSYLITPIIVYINTAVFVAMVLAGLSPLHPTAQSLFEWGGNMRQAVNAGEWWRLITYMFLHGGAMHIFMNTFALLYIGMFLEPLMGKIRFASAYLLTGICAGLMSIAIHSFSVGVGASGAIFGMYGVFLSMLTTNHIQKTLRKTLLRSILFFVVFNLMTGLQGNTDNAAHIGGLLSGIIIGYAYYPGITKRSSITKQLITTSMIAAGVILITIGTLAYLK